MNAQLKTTRHIYLLILVLAVFTYCNKDQSLQSTGVVSSSVIAVAATESAVNAGTATDSVYLLQHCDRGFGRKSIAETSLPAVIADFLAANYSGYTFSKGFVIVNRSGQTTGYVTIIYYNEKPIGIEYDSSGNFVKVLEQREKADLEGKGWHHGGRFKDRDRLQKDTVSLSTLPAHILTYLGTNYSTDTLRKAFMNRDNSYLILSINNGVFATIFDANGNFLNRVQLHAKTGRPQEIEQSALPVNVLTYLNTAFPNYVFKKAFYITEGLTAKGFVVVVDANNTKYAIAFDATGNFLKIKTIH